MKKIFILVLSLVVLALSCSVAYGLDLDRLYPSCGVVVEINYTDDYIVIGGDSVYHTLLPLCDTCIITKVENSYEADAWFDNLDNDPAWQCTERGDDQEYEGLIFHFDTYERI